MRMAIRSGGLSLVIGIAALAASAAASAGAPAVGAVITYAAAGASAIPTLSEWGLIGMALLVAAMAYRSLRGRLGNKPLAAVLLAGTLVLGAIPSTGWIRPAAAVVVSEVALPLAGGGTANVTDLNVDVPVKNTSGVPLKIVSVVATGVNFIDNPAATPKCAAGQILAVGAVCYVKVSNLG